MNLAEIYIDIINSIINVGDWIRITNIDQRSINILEDNLFKKIHEGEICIVRKVEYDKCNKDCRRYTHDICVLNKDIVSIAVPYLHQEYVTGLITSCYFEYKKI